MAEEKFTLMHHPDLKAGAREHSFPSNPRVLARKESEGWVIGPDPQVEKDRKAAVAAREKAEAAAAKAADNQAKEV